MEEWEERLELEDKLESFDRVEELSWKQKAGNKWLLEGDSNTHFFHQFANGRRKNRINVLESDCGEIRDQKEITDHIASFYKNLFGPRDICHFRLSEDFWPLEMKLNEDEKLRLIKHFGGDEIRGVVMDMKVN